MNEYKEELFQAYNNSEEQPSICTEEVILFSKEMKKLLLLDYIEPGFTRATYDEFYNKVERMLFTILSNDKAKDPEKETEIYLSKLPSIRALILESAQAIFDGDPAAESILEILSAYPGFQAICFYRIAHEFYELGHVYLSRIIAERAHQLYGIDINPGAKIGHSFFIDHGTGIVIGETAIIGDRVKLYQGVTLGALSLREGHALRGTKRHPTVEDDVTIYSNASIFGGKTIIGKGSTIGANTYLTKSVPENTLVYLNDQGMTIQRRN